MKTVRGAGYRGKFTPKPLSANKYPAPHTAPLARYTKVRYYIAIITETAMSALETLKLKLLTGDYTFSDPPLKLVDGEPYLPNRSMTLQAARSMQYPPARFKDEARKRAKGLFYSVFEWQCGEHGLTVHHTATGRCAQCYKESKRRTPPARAEAQAQRDATYMAGCLVHGVVEHSTARGLCLSCYNTLGQPRPLATNPAGYYVNREGKIKNCS